MKLVKISLPNKEFIITNNKFFIDTIVPITIKEHVNSYIIFFAANQKCDDKTIYLQMMVSPDTDLEKEYFKNHFLLNKSSDLEKNMTSDNLYIVDFCMDDMNDNMYFHSTGVRPIQSSGKTFASILDLYISVSIFTKIQLYIDGLVNINTKSLTYSNELVFTEPLLNTVTFINIDNVRLEVSAKLESNLYITHYKMMSGKTEFRMNYVSLTKKDGISLLKDPTTQGNFMILYENKYFLDSNKIFLYNEKLYIFYVENLGVSTKSYLLCLNKDLIDKTNFINSDYIFEEEENTNG